MTRPARMAPGIDGPHVMTLGATVRNSDTGEERRVVDASRLTVTFEDGTTADQFDPDWWVVRRVPGVAFDVPAGLAGRLAELRRKEDTLQRDVDRIEAELEDVRSEIEELSAYEVAL